MSGSLWRLLLGDFAWAGIAAVGFALLFNVPRRMLLPCFLTGGLPHAVRVALLGAGLGIEPATLVACVLLGFIALWFARGSRLPVSIFSVTAAIPMVPGALAFKAMIGMLRLVRQGGAASPELLAETFAVTGRTGLILMAIAVGVGAPVLVLRQSETRELDRR
ncbi:MAG: threonine/serine exporter family protein [Deltaproteobacteria bacterium]|nr:threonine/serine exporter family protein [Deltaproteobacteria bacterium]